MGVNAVRSVPHDRGLRDCYEVRAKEHAQLLIENEKRMRRRAQLHAIWSPSCEIQCSIHRTDKWQFQHILSSAAPKKATRTKTKTKT